MIDSVEEYLIKLKAELDGCDSALIQDAMSDAEEHLRSALITARDEASTGSETETLRSIIGKYGDPKEIAAAYKDMESRMALGFIPSRVPAERNFISRFFGIFSDPRAWGAALYMLISGLTGTVFGLWGILGAVVSAPLFLFIIGLPMTGLFLLSIRGIGLIEGRIVEAFLGVRMPRKPLFSRKDLSLSDKFKSLIAESHTWKSFVYIVLLFPLGWIYCLSILFFFFMSVCFILSPLLELVLHLPLELFGFEAYTPVWFLPVVVISGLFLLPITFHLAKWVGSFQGRFAKHMLVRK
ncbi:MAG: sensor domain-containing protein [Candidatus Aminicenantes bacterium]|nr:sensor domain-containing protein [Candidatus Aminicenantes bacterium]